MNGERAQVFCASMADVFERHRDRETNARLDAERARLWALIRETPNLDWQLLTKRPQNIAAMLPDDWGQGYANVWLGTTVENQKFADLRIPQLLAVPAAVRFLSCEPLLGPVDLDAAYVRAFDDWDSPIRALNACPRSDEFCPTHDGYTCSNCGGTAREPDRTIDWVIAGGESGPKARPSHPEWYRSLRDQCQAARIPFLFKQWGAFAPVETYATDAKHRLVFLDGRVTDIFPGWGRELFEPQPVKRETKKLAGRLLDGRTWDEMPALAAAGVAR